MFDVAAEVYAHRGLWDAVRPANSLAAFRAAADSRLGVELDVRVTLDGELVVFHDRDVRRLCGRDLLIAESPVDRVKELRLPDGGPIPTLAEALDVLADVPVLIEVKVDEASDRRAIKAIPAGVNGARARTAVMSFDEETVRSLAALGLAKPIGQLIEPDISEAAACRKAERALAAGATYLAPHLSVLPAIAGAFPHVHLVSWTVRREADLALVRTFRAAPIFEAISPALAKPAKVAI